MAKIVQIGPFIRKLLSNDELFAW